MNVLVLGATGTVGSQVVRVLLERGDQVRVLTRNPEKAARLGSGVDVAVGDLASPATLGPAFEALDGVFLLNALSPSEAQEGLVALEWAKRARVRKLVYLSVHHVDDAPHIPHFGSKVAVETAVRRSGIDHTILRPSNFFQNDRAAMDAIVKHGVYPRPIGDIGLNGVDVRDIADAAGLAFAGRASNETVALVGPDVLTAASVAAAYARHLGRPVGHGNDLDAWAAQMRRSLPEWLVFDLRMMFAYFQQHGLLASPQELEACEGLLGHPLRRFDAFVGEALASVGA
jgi:uncharacterized protein YbjT (DUF2867 family)